jgi:hypothetical protein
VRIQDILEYLDTVHDYLLAKHEKDFITAYRDHMLKVQMELVQYKQKSTDFYLGMKENERNNFLEKSINWLRSESV